VEGTNGRLPAGHPAERAGELVYVIEITLTMARSQATLFLYNAHRLFYPLLQRLAVDPLQIRAGYTYRHPLKKPMEGLLPLSGCHLLQKVKGQFIVQLREELLGLEGQGVY